MATRTLTGSLAHDHHRSEVIAFYDRFGGRQDAQGWYEDPALARLIQASEFSTAHHVCEFACGTGRLAAQLLGGALPASARYLGLDASATMVALAKARLAPWSAHAVVRQTDGAPHLPEFDADGSPWDRIVCTYALDLLRDDDVDTWLREAARVLPPGGRLCTVGLTPGPGLLSGAVTLAWRLARRINWRWVGNCRPMRVAQRLSTDHWRLLHHEIVVTRGIASEVLVAERR